jgi:hypothetical protein
MARDLPRPPTRGHANSTQRGHDPRRHAKLYNLDTHEHVDADGVEQKSTDGTPPNVGAHTIILASSMGHPAMKAGDHDRLGTNVAKLLEKMAITPRPRTVARKIERHMRANDREGSPGEEAAETVQQEAAEKRAGTEKPTRKRLPLPPRRVA